MNDIFTDMQEKIGCTYLSDLPYYKRAVWFEMKRLYLSDYPKKQLEDFSRFSKESERPLEKLFSHDLYSQDNDTSQRWFCS